MVEPDEKPKKRKEWEVERIVGVKYNEDNSREFLIHWKGYREADDSWEAETNLNCPDLIKKFMTKHAKRS